MLKSGRDLKTFYKDLILLNCLAYDLNLVSKVVSNSFENVNNFTANVKQMFLKAPLKVKDYKETLPNLLFFFFNYFCRAPE